MTREEAAKLLDDLALMQGEYEAKKYKLMDRDDIEGIWELHANVRNAGIQLVIDAFRRAYGTSRE